MLFTLEIFAKIAISLFCFLLSVTYIFRQILVNSPNFIAPNYLYGGLVDIYNKFRLLLKGVFICHKHFPYVCHNVIYFREICMSNKNLLYIRCVKYKEKFSVHHYIQLRKGMQYKVNITKRIFTRSTKVYSHKPRCSFLETSIRLIAQLKLVLTVQHLIKIWLVSKTTTAEKSRRILCNKNWHTNLTNTIHLSDLPSAYTMQSNWWPITLTPTVPWDLATSLSCRPFSKMWSASGNISKSLADGV